MICGLLRALRQIQETYKANDTVKLTLHIDKQYSKWLETTDQTMVLDDGATYLSKTYVQIDGDTYPLMMDPSTTEKRKGSRYFWRKFRPESSAAPGGSGENRGAVLGRKPMWRPPLRRELSLRRILRTELWWWESAPTFSAGADRFCRYRAGAGRDCLPGWRQAVQNVPDGGQA